MIHGTDLITQIRTIARNNQRFVYQKPEGTSECHYVHRDVMTDAPIEGEGCIVGRSLVDLGLSPQVFEILHLEGQNARAILRTLEAQGLTQISDEDITWIHHAQQAQDVEVPWKRCVLFADLRRDGAKVDVWDLN